MTIAVTPTERQEMAIMRGEFVDGGATRLVRWSELVHDVSSRKRSDNRAIVGRAGLSAR
jgi:hypothetical protein